MLSRFLYYRRPKNHGARRHDDTCRLLYRVALISRFSVPRLVEERTYKSARVEWKSILLSSLSYTFIRAYTHARTHTYDDLER